MKITIQENKQQDEIEIVIHCRKADEEIQSIVAALSSLDQKITGVREGRTYVLDPIDILYFESVDKKTFIYTQAEVLETPFRLYELEERLSRNFFRASKSSIINIDKITSIFPDFGGRLEVTLITGERMMVSRQYAHDLKMKLEL